MSVAGCFDVEGTLAAIRTAFGAIPPGTARSCAEAVSFGHGIETTARDIAQNHLAFAFPGVTSSDPKRYTYELLSCILGGGSTSRLFERIREEAGLAYAIYSYQAPYRQSGMLGVYAAVAPENLEQTFEYCFEELDSLCTVAVSEEELGRNKEQLKGGLLIALEGTFNRMPVWPNPPSSRWVAFSESDFCQRTASTGATTNWAIRSPRFRVKGSWPWLMRSTLISPR